MSRSTIRIAATATFILGLAFIGLLPASSDSQKNGRIAPVIDASYRSRAGFHKVMVYKRDQALRDSILARGGSVIAEYESFSLLSMPSQDFQSMRLESPSATVRDDMNVILLRAGAFDTTQGEPQFANLVADEPAASAHRLYLVQMVGPVKQEWLDEIASRAEIVTYIPNNAYLVRADDSAMQQIEGLKSPSGFVQWTGAYKPVYKLSPEIALDSESDVFVTVQMLSSERGQADIQSLASYASEPPSGVLSHLNYTNVRMKVRASSLAEIARRDDVIWIEPVLTPELFDERQGHIVAGNYEGNQLATTSYLAWLQSKGITSTPDFLVDIADSGIDKGVLDPSIIHPDFLNESGLSRVIYARLINGSQIEGTTNDLGGHGTLNASIVGGYNILADFPNRDLEGYSFGLGIHPFVRLGVSKIFNPDFTNPDLILMLDSMYADGVRISSNSWGAYTNDYTTDSQLYDSLVRDARSGTPGNQEITVVFASGNRGQNNLSVPGTAKNVITVGASENIRIGLDGCQISSEGADDIDSIISFSSGGKTSDGRVKPDLVAPGTHIQGAASQDAFYNGLGVCGPKFFPEGQTLYTWSSGTSHATPAVAGAAAVLRQYFEETTGQAPSPAMIKAFLANSATYMRGNLAGGNLPATSQGWGLTNLGRALDDTPRLMVDQDQVFSETGEEITLSGSVGDPTKPFRVTLAWTDAPGSPAANPVVNNLDLQVEIDGKTYLGNRFSGEFSVEVGSPDPLNNVEAVYLPAGVSGDFVVRIVAANITGDGVPGNGDGTDQDFALVVYNVNSDGGGPADPPPSVTITHPVGGEQWLVGNTVRITWDASDDKQIESQKVEFSSDNGNTYSPIATLDGQARHFDWKIPMVPTATARIKVTVLDGVNLPVSSVSPASFEVINGPPDTTPPVVTLSAPTSGSIVGGGTSFKIKWRETDNVGVLTRVIEYSVNKGRTYEPIVTLTAPSSGEEQEYEWQVPAELETKKGRVRIRVFDGAGNAAEAVSKGKFTVWPTPIITDVNITENGNGRTMLEIFGRKFRMNETEIYVNGTKLKKLRFDEKCDESGGTCKKVMSLDKKLDKRVPEGQFSIFVVKLTPTGQTSPEFRWKRKRPKD
ncbi:MAG TPA: S8 family serine peptidase [Blastocatellia bacterium]|nr:S8 family serine peptidase [Blastocatellia bacterium]